MKLPCSIITLSLSFLAISLFGQAKSTDQLSLIFPSLPSGYQSNILVVINPEHPQPCPLKYTNLLSNTNLFTSKEAMRIKEVALKYQNVTTNSGPAGCVFKGWVQRERNFQQYTDRIQVACFSYTNSPDREEIASMFNNRLIIAHFRTPTNYGYDVLLTDGMLTQYQEYKKGVLDGLFIGMGDSNRPDVGINRCYSWMRFAGGKAVGNYFGWNEKDEMAVQLVFKKPFDYLKYQAIKTDLSWTEVPTNSPNFAPSQK